MPPRFLGKTVLGELAPLRIDGRPVLEQYERVRSVLAARAGQAAAALLAEPVVTPASGDAPGSVSWYADVPGETAPLHMLPADQQALVAAALRNALAGVEPLLADPEHGPLLRAALAIASPDGIRAVDGRVVLTEWGLSADPEAAGGVAAPLAASPIGAFLGSARVGADREAPARVLPTAANPHFAPASAASAAAAAAVSRPRTWSLLAAGLVIAALFLGLGVWLGNRMVRERLASQPGTAALFDEAAARQALERQRAENAALERQVEERRRALDGNVCLLDPAAQPLGPDTKAAVSPATVPPPAGRPPFQGSIADLLKQGVVFVLAPVDGGASTGSGFFVTADTVVTNRHVIERADPNRIFVINAKLGTLTPVRPVAETPDSQIGDLDVAALKLGQPAAVQPLSVTTTVAELDPVIAAGYPALTASADEAYGRLLHEGDSAAVPQLILTDGRISAIQDSPSGVKLMPHTAAISGGNSGGPLVDACGRVVGINTFIAADREQAASAKWAQKVDQVVAFLASKGVAITPLTAACAAPPPAQPQRAAPATPPPRAAPEPTN